VDYRVPKTYFTPLYFAAGYRQDPDFIELPPLTLHGSIHHYKAEAPQLVKLLLDAKADANQANGRPQPGHSGGVGSTALHYASGTGNFEVAKVLLDNGASVNYARASDGMTPLFMAITCDDLHLIKYFLSLNVNVNKGIDENKFSPLHLACLRGDLEIVRFLVVKGAKVTAMTKWKDGVHMKVEDPLTDDKVTPIHCAASRGHLEICKWLVIRGLHIHPNTTLTSSCY